MRLQTPEFSPFLLITLPAIIVVILFLRRRKKIIFRCCKASSEVQECDAM